jgi:hypothetical protein
MRTRNIRPIPTPREPLLMRAESLHTNLDFLHRSGNRYKCSWKKDARDFRNDVKGIECMIAIEIELEKIAWIVARAARLCGLRTLEAQLRHRQTGNEPIQNTTDMVCRDQVVQHHRKQASPDPAPRLGYSSSNLPLRQASSHLHLFKREFRNRLEGALLPNRGIAALPREEISGKGPGACEGEESETRRVRNASSERRAEEVGLY